VRLEWRHKYDQVWRLEGGIEFWDSPFDPVADLPVRRLVEFEFAEGTTESSGRVLRPVPGDWLLPFIHQRYDEPETEGVEV
jgi:acetoacetate decarboxylase